MSNPTFNAEMVSEIAAGGYNVFEFANEKYFWSAPVRVSARIGYKAIDTSDRSLGFEDTLELDLTNSSGGTNGLDCVETAEAMMTLLHEAVMLVEELRANKDVIIAEYRAQMEARLEADRQAEAAAQAKINADTTIGTQRAKQIVQTLFENAKKNDHDHVNIRRRGEDVNEVFHAQFTGSIVAFSERGKFRRFTRIRRSALIAKIAKMAEVVETKEQAAA